MGVFKQKELILPKILRGDLTLSYEWMPRWDGESKGFLKEFKFIEQRIVDWSGQNARLQLPIDDSSYELLSDRFVE